MVQLRDLEPKLEELGFQLIGISPDQPAKIRETIQALGIRFTLLSDSSMAAARSLGLAYVADDATRKALAQYGIDLEAASGESHHQLPVPAVFLIQTNRVIQFEYVNPDYTVRAHPDLLLTAARISAGR